MAAQSSPQQPIIIIRKKVSHEGGHHGGAWKVAYADFVTAMMALFVVLWLMASSDQVKKSIASYFLDPQGRKHEFGSGGLNGSGQSMFLSVNDMQKLKDKLQQALKSIPAIEKLKDQITMTITGEGLRVELVETRQGVFFESGSPQPTSLAVQAIGVLASQLGQLPNSVIIEGHTDAATYSSSTKYNNWDLSTDRAHEARKLMQAHGVRADQIKQIRGYADQNLRNVKDPLDPSNRRISVIVLYGERPAAADPNKVPAEAVNVAANSNK